MITNFDNALESKNFVNSVQYINKNHEKNYFFSRKIAKKGHYDHSKTKLTCKQKLLTLLLHFFQFNVKSAPFKSKNKSYTFANS